MAFITEDGLKELKNYKYVGGSYSKIDNWMNSYWMKVSDLVPSVLTSNFPHMLSTLLRI